MGEFVFILLSVVCLSGFMDGTESCDLPPGLWCSSPESATRCQVENQCTNWLQTIKNAPLVEVALYYESLCPDCKEFIAQQLWPAYKKIRSIMNVTLVPYGNADEVKKGNKWKFTCQHGPSECLGNILETCAIYLMKNISHYLPFIHCFEKKFSIGDPIFRIVKYCSKQYNIDPNSLMNCSENYLGNHLEHEMALLTKSLNPPNSYVPWIVLNGVHTEKIQEEADRDLIKLVCETYRGDPKPEACMENPVNANHCMKEVEIKAI